MVDHQTAQRATQGGAVGRWLGGALLLVVAAGVTVTGCQDRYAAERLLWHANRNAAAVQRDPLRAAEADVSAAVDGYRQVVDRCPGTLEAARAQMAIGSIYYSREQYAQAQEAFALVWRLYGQFRELAANAQFLKGQALERQDQWDEAVQAYEELFTNQPWTMQAMRARFYIAEAWERRGDQAASQKAYERAIKVYREAVKAAPTPELASQMYSFIAVAHERLQQWEEALGIYQTIAQQFPNTSKAPVALFAMGALYKSRLNDHERSKETFGELIKQYPDHFLARVVQTELRAQDEPRASQQ
jgi:TolA-binding protein